MCGVVYHITFCTMSHCSPSSIGSQVFLNSIPNAPSLFASGWYQSFNHLQALASFHVFPLAVLQQLGRTNFKSHIQATEIALLEIHLLVAHMRIGCHSRPFFRTMARTLPQYFTRQILWIQVHEISCVNTAQGKAQQTTHPSSFIPMF